MTVVVIGGGLAGALTARALDQSGREVVVVDAGDDPGGVTVPVRRDGYLLEPAAGTVLLPHPHLSPLLAGMDLAVRPVEEATTRRFVRHGGVTAGVAPSPRLLLTHLVSPAGKLRMLAEPMVRRNAQVEETLESFMVRRLGAEAGRLAAWLMAAGVHAGDPARLSTAAAFPRLAALEATHGSLLRGGMATRRAARRGLRPSSHVISGGTAELARAAARSLGERWRPSWPVERLEQAGDRWLVHGPDRLVADAVVAAVSPEVLATLHPLTSSPGQWDWAPVAVVWLGLDSPGLPDGMGTLIGPDEGSLSLGFLYESSYAPERAPAGRGLVKALVGGARRPDAVDLPDDQLMATVTAELGVVLGVAPGVVMSHVIRHRPGIPQYTAARRRRVEALRRALPSGLLVVGWGYDGVGLTGLAEAAAGVVRSLAGD